MKKKVAYASILTLGLLSCGTPPIVSSSSISEDSSSLISSSSEEKESSSKEEESTFASSSEVTTYEKDENGFIKLKEGYLNSDTRPHSFGADIESKAKCPSFRLYLGNELVPVYGVYVNQSHSWDPEAKNRDLMGVASVSIKEGASFFLQTTWVVDGRCKILPSNEGINLSFVEEYRAVKFEITRPGDYVIEYRGNRMLHLFVHEYEESVPYNESNSVYFGPGIHNKNNDSRLKNNSTYIVQSNQTVYIAEGAFIEGAFVASGANNFKIIGKGFVDGSVFDRNANKNTRFIPFDFSSCSNFSFSGFGVLDPAGWCFNLYFSSHIELKGIKIISSRSNGDGISLQSCKHVLVDSCFVRSYDDSIVVKNYPYWSNRAIEGASEDIEVCNCRIYNDLAQCLEIGYETVGETLKDIYFHDITILAATHKAVISIHNANNANIENVRFENITIENLSVGQGDGNPYLIDFSVAHSPTWSDQHKVTGLGSISGVIVKGVYVLGGNRKEPKIMIKGSMETRSSYPHVAHEISNVALEDIYLFGERIDSSYSGIETSYVHNITLDGEVIAE